MLEEQLSVDDQQYGSVASVIEAVEELARACHEARLRMGISQEEVASRAGVTIATYGCIERGRSTSGTPANPTMDTLVRVMEVLGLEAPLSARDTE